MLLIRVRLKLNSVQDSNWSFTGRPSGNSGSGWGQRPVIHEPERVDVLQSLCRVYLTFKKLCQTKQSLCFRTWKKLERRWASDRLQVFTVMSLTICFQTGSTYQVFPHCFLRVEKSYLDSFARKYYIASALRGLFNNVRTTQPPRAAPCCRANAAAGCLAPELLLAQQLLQSKPKAASFGMALHWPIKYASMHSWWITL